MSRFKATISSIAAAALLAGGVSIFTVNASAITFKESNSQDLKRKMPEGEGALLSYYDAVKDAKKCVVNIFTQKTVKQNAHTNPFMNDPFFREFFGKNFNGAHFVAILRFDCLGCIDKEIDEQLTDLNFIATENTIFGERNFSGCNIFHFVITD